MNDRFVERLEAAKVQPRSSVRAELRARHAAGMARERLADLLAGPGSHGRAVLSLDVLL